MPTVSNAGYILDSLHTLLIILRSKVISFFVDLAAHPFNRVLLATIRDKGLCPCPRCLVPKSKLDQTGTKRDSNFRLKNACTYLLDQVRTARNAIYRLGMAIAGAVVDRLLKATSSVPTVVSLHFLDPFDGSSLRNCAFVFRMHLSTNSVPTLISHVCLWSIFYTSSNWVYGKRFLHI